MNNLTFIKHSAAAKSDPRLSVLIDKEGLKGYGLYWMLMECLAHAPRLTASMEVLRVLKKQHRLSADLLQRVLENYGLFVVKKRYILLTRTQKTSKELPAAYPRSE